MNNKIIFLDIDGVLNRYTTEGLNEDFNKENVRNLRIIIRETGALIVISSDWKYDTIRLFNLWPSDILPQYIDTTEKILLNKVHSKNKTMSEIREDEIKAWISYYEKDLDYNIEYVVLDDLPLKCDNFILINARKGLTKEDSNNAIKILNKKEMI